MQATWERCVRGLLVFPVRSVACKGGVFAYKIVTGNHTIYKLWFMFIRSTRSTRSTMSTAPMTCVQHNYCHKKCKQNTSDANIHRSGVFYMFKYILKIFITHWKGNWVSAQQDMKTCTQCHNVKTSTEFYSHRARRDGLDDMCKQCKCIHTRRSKDKLSSYAAKLARKSNLPVATITNLWRQQGGQCALTGFPLSHSSEKTLYNACVFYPAPGTASVTTIEYINVGKDKGDPNCPLVLVCVKANEMASGLTGDDLQIFCRALLSNISTVDTHR